MPTRKRRIKQAPIVVAFGERLREIRVARGLTQKNLADKAHVTLSYISTLEAGAASPGLDLIARLATGMGVTVADLLPQTEVAPSDKMVAKERFDTVLQRAGHDTLSMLTSLLERLADSATIGR